MGWTARSWLLALGLAAAGCTHAGFGSVAGHFARFNVEPPRGSMVFVCHSYGCRMTTRYRFTEADLAALKSLMDTTRKADTPAEERRAAAYAIGWIERRIGKAIGTETDRAGMDFAASGDPTQQDCVDEATNTTSYLVMLASTGLIRHHTIETPFAKDNLLMGIEGWTHWTAVLQETASGQRWAVDSWIYANGENPAIVEVENWYIKDLASLPKPLL